MAEALPQASIDYMTAKIPMRRCGEPDKAARMIAWNRFASLQLHQRLQLRPQRRACDLLASRMLLVDSDSETHLIGSVSRPCWL
jgi:hypothetical protein